jgi:predicted amidohydrolase
VPHDTSSPRRDAGSTFAVEPVVPSEHYLATVDRPAGPPVVRGVDDKPHTFSAGTMRVAIAQLTHIQDSTYLDTKYRIWKDPAAGPFIKRLSGHLEELELRCQALGPAASGALLDMLVLPEVFVPRPFMSYLQDLSNRLGCTVVAGMDYPGVSEQENANECQILRPQSDPVTYRKITRSQYDALKDNRGNRMVMARGDRLVRFVDDHGRGFGVLICYDFSHADLMHRLNLEGRREPLEIMVIIAHNPFGELYRSCCIADSHRYYQYIVMCNVSRFGGSGIFGPLRTTGARQTLIDIGKGTDAVAISHLNLAGLRAARRASDSALNVTEETNPLRDFMRRPGVFQARVSQSVTSSALPNIQKA